MKPHIPALALWIPHKDIDHFHQYQNDHDPLEGEAVSVLQEVFKELHIFFHDTESFLDGAEAGLQVEGFFQADIQFVQVFIFPGLFGRIEYIKVGRDPVFQIQRASDISFSVSHRPY